MQTGLNGQVTTGLSRLGRGGSVRPAGWEGPPGSLAALARPDAQPLFRVALGLPIRLGAPGPRARAGS